jgi:hypothetical protein
VDVTAVAADEDGGSEGGDRDVIVVTITPFYMITNRLNCPLELLQYKTRQALVLPIGESVPFHPLDLDGNGVIEDSERLIRVRQRISDNECTRFSAPFRLDVVQELLLVCDDPIIPSNNNNSNGSGNIVELENGSNKQHRLAPKSAYCRKCDSTSSAYVLGDDIEERRQQQSQASQEADDEGEDERVFAVCTSMNGVAGMEISFIPATKSTNAIRYNFVNATYSDVVGICEANGVEALVNLPVIIHPGKTVPYVFRGQKHVVLVSILRFRELQPIEVEMSNVGWVYELQAEGLFLEIVESEFGRCLTFAQA